MMYTVTCNPSIDYYLYVDSFTPGQTNRSRAEEICCGGKGINVSCILAQLGIPTVALGFIAGFTGAALEKMVCERGIQSDFIKLAKGNTRINVKLKAEDETEINAEGPHIGADAIAQLYEKLDRLGEGDTLILGGSVPRTLPSDFYEQILEKLSGRGIRFVVDATKDLLCNVLRFSPYLIKPNRQELEEIFGRALPTDDDVAAAAAELQARGARNVLVSLGKEGALLLDAEGKLHRCAALGGRPINTVGAGDSMVAGFLAGSEGGYAYALLLGSAAGGATACTRGLATKDEILALMPKV